MGAKQRARAMVESGQAADLYDATYLLLKEGITQAQADRIAGVLAPRIEGYSEAPVGRKPYDECGRKPEEGAAR